MAHPHGDARLPDRLHKGLGPANVAAGEGVVIIRVFVLDVEEHQVGVGQDGLVLPFPAPAVSRQVWMPA